MPGSGTLRPQSAPVAARSIYVGATAKPAGLAGFMGAGFVTAYDRRPTLREQHALRMASMYAEVTGPGYKAREAAVHPSWHNVGAGVISAGSVDNTYLPSPLQNAWGKSRELSHREKPTMPHKQAPQWHGSKRTHETTWMATSSVPVRKAYASQRPSLKVGCRRHDLLRRAETTTSDRRGTSRRLGRQDRAEADGEIHRARTYNRRRCKCIASK